MHSRRNVLKTAVAASAVAAANTIAPTRAEEPKLMNKGRVKQSIVFWCFNARGDKWSAASLAQRQGTIAGEFQPWFAELKARVPT